MGSLFELGDVQGLRLYVAFVSLVSRNRRNSRLTLLSSEGRADYLAQLRSANYELQ